MAPLIIERAEQSPVSLAAREVLQLQRTLGNQAVTRLLAGSPRAGAARRPNPGTLQRGTGEQEQGRVPPAEYVSRLPLASSPDGLRHHAGNPRVAVQRSFEGGESSERAAARAREYGLSAERIETLRWAATAPEPFGSLDDYLQTPYLIELRLAFARRWASSAEVGDSFGQDMEQEQHTSSSSSSSSAAAQEPRRSGLRSSSPFSVAGHPLLLDDEPVRGTLDLSLDREMELEEYRIGLSEANFNPEELERLDEMLHDRDAPDDQERRRLLVEHVNYEAMVAEEEGDDDYEEPFLGESDMKPESDTETEGSDSEDERSYRSDPRRQKMAKARSAREQALLKTNLIENRLKNIRSDNEETRTEEMFKAGKRPAKDRLYRKEARFKHPSVNVSDRAKVPVEPSKREIEDLATVNALLQLGVSPKVAAQLVDSAFVVAQYRGLFYSLSAFTHQSRAQHRRLDETNQPIFSSAALTEGVLGQAGYYFLYNDPSRREDLARYQKQVELEAQRIRQLLLEQRRQPATEEARRAVPNATDRLRPATIADLSTHFYSQDYDGYHNVLSERHAAGTNERPHPLDPLFRGLPNAGNPKVSTGDVPTHAARYAYGLKPYMGHEENVLEPEYDARGKPRHPYSGKMYVSVHPLADYEEYSGPTHLVSLQNKGRTNIGQVIIPERESQFEGMMDAGRVKAQMKAKFPNFSKPYKSVYLDRYGLTESLFNTFRGAFADTEANSDERVFVEALLSNFLAMHSELRAIEMAMRAGGGARLIYRTGPRSFDFTPPIIKRGDAKAEAASVPLRPMTIDDAMALMKQKRISFQGDSKKSEASRDLTPTNLPEQVEERYGQIVHINGDDIACYIRSLVTAAAGYGFVEHGEIEAVVATLINHLEAVQLRTPGQMVDAGGLVAAEVRRVLADMTGRQFEPAVHVVMWNNTTGQITDFRVNTGTHDVWLFYHSAHFDLINRRIDH